MQLFIRPLDRVLDVRAGANLLETLREHAVPLSHSCMAGRCGTCRCRVLEGRVLDAGGSLRAAASDGEDWVLACQAVLTETCTIEIPEPDEVVVHPARILKASVAAIEAPAADVRRLLLKPAKRLEFAPGQYATLQFGPELARPYSMAGLDSDELLEFHIRQVPGGRVSNHVFERLAVGDAVRVSGPLGTAYLRRRHAGPMLCVAGGTGLAPVLAIVRGALEGGMANPIHLYFGVRSAADAYDLDRLYALCDAHPQLKLQVVAATGRPEPGMRAGLVTDAVAADLPDLSAWRAYLCGSPAMVEAMALVARRLGLPPAALHADAFYAQSG